MSLVKVYGPNIAFADGVTFHVHAAGCAHLAQTPYRQVRKSSDQGGWETTVDTTADLIEAIYPSSDFGYDPDDPFDSLAYYDDVHIFPCTGLE